MKKVTMSCISFVFLLTWIYLSYAQAIRPLENASMRPLSAPTNYVSYTSNNGKKTYFVLCIKGVNWTESVGEKGTPVIISDVVGEAGLGPNKDEAKTNLVPIKTKKDSSGKTVAYFEQKKPFQGIKTFYLDLQYGNIGLAYESLKELKFIKE